MRETSGWNIEITTDGTTMVPFETASLDIWSQGYWNYPSPYITIIEKSKTPLHMTEFEV